MKKINSTRYLQSQIVICTIFLCLLGNSSFGQKTVSGYSPGIEAKREQTRVNITPFSKRFSSVKLNEALEYHFPTVENRAGTTLDFRKRKKVGIIRTFPSNIAEFANDYEVEGGKLKVFRITSQSAKALRLKLTEVNLPDGAQLMIYSESNPLNIDGIYTKRGLNNDGVIWSTNQSGEKIIIEFFVPAGTEVKSYFKLAELAHIYEDPLIKNNSAALEDAAGACNLDIPAAWKEASKAVAEIQYFGAGYIYSCSATLVNTTNNSGTPYLLTANHCVNRQTEATSIQTIWFKDSPTVTPVYGPYSPQIVATGMAGDFTLLKFSGALPAGVRFSGWTTDKNTVGTSVTGIHYPQDSYKRISFGKSTSFTCPPEIPAEACGSFQTVKWDQGITEPGSSGSGLFVGAATDPKLTGTLTGGSSSCANPQGEDVYGQFSYYFPDIEYFLTGTGCSYKIDDEVKFAGPSVDEGAISVIVTGNGSCGWTAKSLAPWLTIVAGTSGAGNGTIRYSVEANTGTENRVGYVRIGTHLVAVSQAGSGLTCGNVIETVATGERVFYSRELTSNDCHSIFDAALKADRFKINGKAGQQMRIEVFSDDFEPRVSILTPGGKLMAIDYRRIGFANFITLPTDGVYMIEVSGVNPEDLGKYNLWFYKGCECKFLDRQTTFDSAGGAGEMAFTLPPDCSWRTLSTVPDWLQLTPPSVGSGSGVIKFSVKSEALRNQQRDGIIWLYLDPNQTSNYFQYNVKQAFPCDYTISKARFDVGNLGASYGLLYLFSGNYCPSPEIKSDSSWLKVSNNGSTIEASIGYANLGALPRTAKITAGNATYEIVQPGLGNTCNIDTISFGETVQNKLNSKCPYPQVNGTDNGIYHGSYYAFQGVAGQRIAINFSATDLHKNLYLIAPDGLVLPIQLGQPNYETVRAPGTSSFVLPQSGLYVIAIGSAEADLNRTNFVLTLSAMTGADCSLSLKDNILQTTGKGGNVVANVIQDNGTSCEWDAKSSASWVGSPAPTNSTGNGSVTFSVAPNINGLRIAYLPVAGQHLKLLQEQAQPLGIVSGASYAKQFARGAIASIFGLNLAQSTEPVASLPLPYTLGGTQVQLFRNYPNNLYPIECQLFYASPTQINFLLPEYSVNPDEEFTVYVKRADGYFSVGQLKFSAVAPALFSASSDGRGVAAAVVQRIKGDVQTYDPVVELSGGKFIPHAIDLGGDNEQVYLVLFGTGIRYRTDESNVVANIGGQSLPVQYAGNQNYFAGLDQVNILLPKTLRGKGIIPVSITVDGQITNTLEIKIAP